MGIRSNVLRAAVVVIIVLVTLGTVGVVAGDGTEHSSTDSEVKQIGSQEIEISDVHVTVSDVHLSGSDLPSVHIEERTYTVHDASMVIDGLTITHNGQTYEVCSISIVMDDVSVTVEDVHVD
ncbi:hypothetical protein [Halocatena marina]|uniref:Uncharacterized protein n=1 Tax=Halocatena marina TaxID=2934937 RepID=A0ABD5YTI8_9EURY|nr:hypothetical protein [Halocatena marina]